MVTTIKLCIIANKNNFSDCLELQPLAMVHISVLSISMQTTESALPVDSGPSVCTGPLVSVSSDSIVRYIRPKPRLH